jgi:4,5-DOPA dioxygenase extradiol
VDWLLPSLFLAHGVPVTGLTDNPYMRFLREWAAGQPVPAAAVILLSGDAETALTIGAADRYGGLIQEYGLPDELGTMRYPAEGDRELASDIGILASGHGLSFRFDLGDRLDVRAWTVLQALYPEADVPIVPLFVNGRLVPEEFYRIGRMLSALRRRNVRIIAAGATGYRLRRLSWSAVEPERWQVRFDEWLTDHIAVWDAETLFHYDSRAPHAREAVLGGGEAHLAPLFAAMGAADAEKRADKLHQSYMYGCLSLNAWAFGG